MQAQLKIARAAVNAETFGTPAWEAKMQIVRDLVAKANAAAPKERFHSIDSGEHPTMQFNYVRKLSTDAKFAALRAALG